MNDQEAFEQSYWNFVTALELMAKDAETQCEIMDYYNVACEPKDDISIGYYMLKIASGKLPDNQQNAIHHFLTEVEKLPGHLFNGTTIDMDSLKNMRHPCWTHIRNEASKLIQILKPATMHNESFYQKGPH